MRQLDDGGDTETQIERDKAAARSAGCPRASDRATAPTRRPRGECASAGPSNDADARFCKNCGAKLMTDPRRRKVGCVDRAHVWLVAPSERRRQQMPDPSQMAGTPLPAPELQRAWSPCAWSASGWATTSRTSR